MYVYLHFCCWQFQRNINIIGDHVKGLHKGVLIWFIFIYFGIILFLSQKTFLNRSFILFALNKSFQRVKALHSMKKCLTVLGVWYVIHYGCFHCLRIKGCVSLLWKIYNWDMITCSFLDFLPKWVWSGRV